MSTKSDMDTNEKRRRRKRWPEALKREIVAATLVPGASVSVVARQYDVNANQVFSWRRAIARQGKPPPASSSTRGLVPVTITPEPEGGASAPPASIRTRSRSRSAGNYRVRVGSSFDGRALRRVLDVLRQR